MPCPTNKTVDVQRMPDWEERLVSWLMTARDTPFKWGSFDCALAVAGAVTAITGHDFISGWQGGYDSDKGALKALLKRGYRDVYEAVSGELGQDATTELATLGRGDLGGAVVDGEKTLGLIWAGRLWLPEPYGLRPHALSLMVCGWAVGPYQRSEPCRQ